MKWSEATPVFNYSGQPRMNTRIGWLLIDAANRLASYRTGNPRGQLITPIGIYKRAEVRSAVRAISFSGRAFEMPDPKATGPCPNFVAAAATFEERVAARQALREVLHETGRLDLRIECLGGEPIVRQRTPREWAAQTETAEQVACLVMAAYRADEGKSGAQPQIFDASAIRPETSAERVLLSAASAFRRGEYPDGWTALQGVPIPDGADDEGRQEALGALRTVLGQTARGDIFVNLPWHYHAARREFSGTEWAAHADTAEQVACLLMAVECAKHFHCILSAIRKKKQEVFGRCNKQ